MAYHLRPVADTMSPSPSPTASTSTPDPKASSTIRTSPTANSNARVRRPLSPSSLRDVDLTHSNDGQPRKYPAPPTGHDLMAMFPPPPPDNFPESRPGATSGYFQRQERAFFAQAGKEIVRVRVEVDLPHGSGGSRSWQPPSSGSHAASASASQSPSMPTSAVPVLYPGSRPSPRNGLSVPLFPLSTNHPHPHSHSGPPSNHHGTVALHQNSPDSRSIPQEASIGKGEYPEDYDEDWRRQAFHHPERSRRAGKHTKRVIVRP